MTIESDARNEFHFPRYSRGEVLADAAAHITGVTLGLIATIALLITASQNDEALLILGAGLYGLGLLAMLTCSAGYNMWPPSPTKELWRRFDHAAIFIMIAGTYTPLLLNRMGGEWGVGLLIFVWTAALIGANKRFSASFSSTAMRNGWKGSMPVNFKAASSSSEFLNGMMLHWCFSVMARLPSRSGSTITAAISSKGFFLALKPAVSISTMTGR